MSEQNTSGYAKLVPGAQKIFVGWDKEKILHNFSALMHDDQYFSLEFLAQPIRVELQTGAVFCKRGGAWLEYTDPHAVITILDMLCSEKPLRLSGEWCSIPSFSPYLATGSTAEVSLNEKHQHLFEGNKELVREACLSLGGVECVVNKSADLSYQIHLFDFYPLIFQFWEADDEFPVQIKTLWDKNTLDYLLFETVFYALTCLMERLDVYLSKRIDSLE